MALQEITEQKVWDARVVSPHAPFLQSFAWGEFQRAKGFRVHRVTETFGKDHVSCQWIAHKLPLGLSYWYAPYGPITSVVPSSSDYHQKIGEYLSSIRSFVGGNAVFLRIEPVLEVCYESQIVALGSTLKLRKTSSVQVKNTRMLDLKKSEEELLAAMHPKTRYNIGLAERKGVVVKKGKEFIKEFVALNKETTARDKFHSHPDTHYQMMAKMLPDNVFEVYAAEFDGRIIAANIVIHWGGTTTYVHGASASQDRNVMAPHLLQWKQIQDAKVRGSSYYDFWGVAPPNIENHPWAGITKFKEGFGGFKRAYVGAFDLPLREKLYTIYNVLRKYA